MYCIIHKSVKLLAIAMTMTLAGYSQSISPSTLISQLSGQKDPENAIHLIDAMANAGLVPVVYEDSCLFLYKGKAEKVEWIGDFNAWGGDNFL